MLCLILFGANTHFVYVWSVLFVDVYNAFNSLNCTAMLLHACVLWPRCSLYSRTLSIFRIVRNLKEGVTQDDPLSMFMYALGHCC